MALDDKNLEHSIAGFPRPVIALNQDEEPALVTPKPLLDVSSHVGSSAAPLAPELVSFILPKRGASPEEQEAFGDFFNKLMRTFRPGDVVEQIEIARIANLMWDCACLNRFLNSILRNARDESLKKLLKGRTENADDIAAGVRSGDPQSIKIAQSILSRFGLDDEDLHAQSFIDHVETIERLKRMEMQATREFTRLLKDLDYRKKVREASRLRELHESLKYQQFRRHGFDVNMKVPN